MPPRQVLIATYLTFGARRALRHLPDRRRRLAAPRGRRRLDPRRRALHRRPAPVRLRRARRGVRVPVLRHRRRHRLVLRAGPAAAVGGVRAAPCPVGLLASAILVVNNVRDIDTDRRAGKRTLAVRLGRERTRGLYAAMLAGAFVVAPLPWPLGSMDAWLLLPWLALPLAIAVTRVVRTPGRTGRRSTARSRAPGSSSSSSACCSPPGSSRRAASIHEAGAAPRTAAAHRAAAGGVGRGHRARAALSRSPARTASSATARPRRCPPTAGRRWTRSGPRSRHTCARSTRRARRVAIT